MRHNRVKPGKKYGACPILNREEAPWKAKYEHSEATPEAVLLGEGKLDANTFVDLGAGNVLSFRYGDVCAWRLAALGYSK